MTDLDRTYVWKAYVVSAATVVAIISCSENHLLLTATVVAIISCSENYLLLTATVVAIISCSANHFLLTVILFIILCTLVLNERKVSPLFYILVGVGGLAAETVCLYLGVRSWGYRDHRFTDVVPYWLAPMWAIVGGGVLATYVLASIGDVV